MHITTMLLAQFVMGHSFFDSDLSILSQALQVNPEKINSQRDQICTQQSCKSEIFTAGDL